MFCSPYLYQQEKTSIIHPLSSWSSSKLALSERQGTPWTGRSQSQGLHTHSHPRTINPTCMSCLYIDKSGQNILHSTFSGHKAIEHNL